MYTTTNQQQFQPPAYAQNNFQQQQVTYNPNNPQNYPPNQGYPPNQAYPPNQGYPQQPQAPGYGFNYQPPPPQHQAPPPNMQSNYPDPESGSVPGFDFSDQTVRKAFVRKVYSILMVQLLITFGFITLFVYNDDVKRGVEENWWTVLLAVILVLVLIIVLACCGNMRRKAPLNYILLLLFTLAEAFLLGVVSSYYDTDAVMMAVGVTAGLCLALTLFAWQTKFDFTAMGGVLVVLLFSLFFFGLIALIWSGSRTVNLIYAWLGVIIFSLYLMYDTQLILGGKHKYSISPEEYVFAALNLYTDIIQIFMYMLMIFGGRR